MPEEKKEIHNFESHSRKGRVMLRTNRSSLWPGTSKSESTPRLGSSDRTLEVELAAKGGHDDVVHTDRVGVVRWKKGHDKIKETGQNLRQHGADFGRTQRRCSS